MVDTVKLFAPHQLRYRAGDLPDGWEYKGILKRKARGDDNCQEFETHVYRHVSSGLCATGNETEVRNIQVSLPKLLHGSNGVLIKTADELETALCRTSQTLRQIGLPTTFGRTWFSRVDLVWHFPGNPQDFFLAHEKVRHPRVRKATVRYDGQSISWRGCNFAILMYDKSLEQNKRSGDVVRVEVQLRGKRLRDCFGIEDGQLTELDFDECYSVYRKILLGFEPAALPQAEGRVAELAMGAIAGWKFNGVSHFDIWARGKNPRVVRSMRAKIGKLVLEDSNIKWSELLPEAGPPPPVEVQPLPLR